MNRQPFQKPPRWWSPKLSPFWLRYWRPLRMREQLKKQRLLDVDVVGIEHVRGPLDEGCGVLITPNHSSHADGCAIYAAADRIGTPLYAMMAWQVFQRSGWLRQMILRHHGCFSIDREGTDLAAIRQARQILEAEPYPLVIFPEGEVYHLNERVTPFREGPAAIALMAARKADRPVACVPCAIRYHYLQDCTPALLELMDRLEQAVHWRPRPDLSLPQRIYHLAEGLIALKEVELLGQTSCGPLPERIAALIEFILGRVEARHGIDPGTVTVPGRVKAARQQVIKQLEAAGENEVAQELLFEDLDDLFLVVQAYSYPGNYVSDHPTIERMAETLDKFEEDLLGAKTATIRGTRRATVEFGEPIPVSRDKRTQDSAAQLTGQLELAVQSLLDGLDAERDELGRSTCRSG